MAPVRGVTALRRPALPGADATDAPSAGAVAVPVERAALAVAIGKLAERRQWIAETQAALERAEEAGRCPRFSLAVDPTPVGDARRRGKHLDALVIPDGFDIHSAPPGQFPDRQGL
jgi:hypothetical protein